MGGRVCEICGVREKQRSGFFANFPLDEKRCKEWVRVVGQQDLVHMPIEKLHEIRFVCGDHFVKKDFNKKGNRLLKRDSIPKHKLIAAPLSDDHLEEFPLHVASKIGPDMQPGPLTNQQVLPSTAVGDHTTDVQRASSTCRQELMLPAAQCPDMQPGPLTNQQVLPSTAVGDHTTDVQRASSTCRQELMLHASQQTTPKRRKYAEPEKDDEIKKRKLEDNSNMTPRKKKLVAQLQKTKRTLSSLRKSAKLIEKNNSPILKDLVAADLKNTNKKPKGRRWTLKEKISALAIFKRSPKTYRYLAHGLMLPSIKTLHNLLRKIPMATGINKAVLQHLQRVSSTMDVKNKCCALLFDEMPSSHALYTMKLLTKLMDMRTKEKCNQFFQQKLEELIA